MVSALRPLIRCSSGDANLKGHPVWTRAIIDMSLPKFLWLSSGLRKAAEMEAEDEAIVYGCVDGDEDGQDGQYEPWGKCPGRRQSLIRDQAGKAIYLGREIDARRMTGAKNENRFPRRRRRSRL
jgi:hypothetical protein